MERRGANLSKQLGTNHMGELDGIDGQIAFRSAYRQE